MLGAAGALYNAVNVGLLRLSDRLSGVSSVSRAAIIGAAVGLVAWFSPALVGGGDNLTQAILANRFAAGSLVAVFLARFLLGPWSYAAAAPGGIFAPLLVLGASAGALFAGVLNHYVPMLNLSPVAFAVVGMAALFSASVRAPLTGIVLTVEMTGRGDLTLALLGASLVAMVVAMLLKSGVSAPRLQPRVATRVAALAEPIWIFQCQHIGQGDQRAYSLYLLQQRRLRVALLGDLLDLPVVLGDSLAQHFQCLEQRPQCVLQFGAQRLNLLLNPCCVDCTRVCAHRTTWSVHAPHSPAKFAPAPDWLVPVLPSRSGYTEWAIA